MGIPGPELHMQGLGLFFFQQEPAGYSAAEGALDGALGELGLLDDGHGARVAALVVALLEEQLGRPAQRGCDCSGTY